MWISHFVTTIGTVTLVSGSALAGSHEEHALAHVADLFADGAIVGDPAVVDCTLSEGTQTRCVAISVLGVPVDHELGPWCPNNIADSEEAGGIWLEYGEVQVLDGAFFANLAEFYDDPVWNTFDPETGDINVTRTLEQCQLAARPQVDPEYNNYCVQCEPEYFQHTTVKTYVLPITPVAAANPSPTTDNLGVAVALNGARIDGPAPKDDILAAHTIAAFDDCGGHVNLGVGYHYHAVMGCSEEAASVEGHAPIIGIALDGHLLHARLDKEGNEAVGLDDCRGHSAEGIGYHYHANDPGANQVLPCHTAQVGCNNFGEETACDATNPLSHRAPRMQREQPPSE